MLSFRHQNHVQGIGPRKVSRRRLWTSKTARISPATRRTPRWSQASLRCPTVPGTRKRACHLVKTTDNLSVAHFQERWPEHSCCVTPSSRLVTFLTVMTPPTRKGNCFAPKYEGKGSSTGCLGTIWVYGHITNEEPDEESVKPFQPQASGSLSKLSCKT